MVIKVITGESLVTDNEISRWHLASTSYSCVIAQFLFLMIEDEVMTNARPVPMSFHGLGLLSTFPLQEDLSIVSNSPTLTERHGRIMLPGVR